MRALWCNVIRQNHILKIGNFFVLEMLTLREICLDEFNHKTRFYRKW